VIQIFSIFDIEFRLRLDAHAHNENRHRQATGSMIRDDMMIARSQELQHRLQASHSLKDCTSSLAASSMIKILTLSEVVEHIVKLIA